MAHQQNAWQNFPIGNNHQQNGYFIQNNVMLRPHRKWALTTFGRNYRTGNPGHPFRLMSYNILAQTLLERHEYLYHAHDSQFLNWPHRLNCIVREILTVQPAILCLQEVQESHLKEIEEALRPMNYEKPLYKKRTSHNYDDGCAIFYNAQYFELIEYHAVEYFQPNVKVSQVFLVIFFGNNLKSYDLFVFLQMLDKYNVAIIAKFASKWLENVEFVVATTHLLYNPRRDDIRTAQLQVLLAELDRMAVHSKTQEPLPIILTGDFNCLPFSQPYRLVSHGHIASNNLPLRLGIMDDCQHFNVARNIDRENTALHNSNKAKPSTEKAKSDESNDCADANIPTTTDLEQLGLPYNTGSLWHYLNFMPTLHSPELASTHQDKWIMVDFIFYTKYTRRTLGPLGQPPKYSTLKLIANYELPLICDCNAMGPIPNWVYGSDHYSMASEFVLTSR